MKPQISGSFGPSVIVKSGNKKMINIAGGSNSGDVYREMESSSEDPFARVRRIIGEENLPEPQKEEISKVVSKVQEEISRGPDANVGLIIIILSRLQDSAPRVLQPLAQAICESSNNPALRAVASQALSPLA